MLGSWVRLLVPPPAQHSLDNFRPKETGCECNRCPCQRLPEGREIEITVLAAEMCGVGVGRASGGESEEGWRESSLGTCVQSREEEQVGTAGPGYLFIPD